MSTSQSPSESAIAHLPAQGQDSGDTSHYAQSVVTTDALIHQCLAQADHNSTSDNNYDSESSSEEGGVDLRRLCQSQEDLSIRSPLAEAWQLPLYNRFVLPPSLQRCSAPGDKMAGHAKRITDDESPSVKRSRASSEESWSHSPHSPQRQRHVFRGGLQYHGPSTYRMGCVERDKNSDADFRTLEMLSCHPVDNTPDVVFQFSTHLSHLGDSPPADMSQYQHSRWEQPCHAMITCSEMVPSTLPDSCALDTSRSPQEDNSPDLVVRSNDKLGPPLSVTQRCRGPPRRPPSHAINAASGMAPRTLPVPSTPGSWRHQEDVDDGPDSSFRSNDRANPRRVSLPSQSTWRHQNHWETPSCNAGSSSEMELTMSPISRTFETSYRQEDAAPPLPQRRHSSWAPASHGIAGSRCQNEGRDDNTPEIVLRYNNMLGPPPRTTAQRRHSFWPPSSHGVARPSATAALNGSRCLEEGSDDNAQDTVIRYSNRFGPPPRMMGKRQQGFWAPQSSSSEVALAESPVATPAAKQWPYSLSISPSTTLAKVVGLLDTHCHLDFIFNKVGHQGTFAKFRLEHRDTFPDCYEGCVANFCNPATFKQYATRNDLLDEDGVWGAFGCHPHMAAEYNSEVEENLIRALEHPSVVALGEIGLDYSYKNMCEHETQQRVFRRQLHLALNRRLPLVIHSRDSTPDTIRIMKEMVPEDYPIHRHCFTGGWEEAQEWLEAFPSLCLGLTPLVAFERVDIEPIIEAARNIPLGRLLLETDSPYFLPKWEMGRLRQSHPGMAIHVATRLSRLRNIPVEKILAVTRENARRVYGI